MSKARNATRFTAASVVTALFGAAIYAVSTRQEIKAAPPKQIIAVSAAVIALTWIAALA